MVYDQDKVFISNENSGDLVLTSQFKTYVRDRGFKIRMCRKADPESKGKIENVVKYIKQNFLYNRTFYDMETLNQDGLRWLERTANKLDHALTKKAPHQEWLIEQAFLQPFEPLTIPLPTPSFYAVRKDNTISWKSNLYSLPLGTYAGRGTQVCVHREESCLIICHVNKTELCRHMIATGRGMKIVNTDHKRDKSAALEEMAMELSRLTESGEVMLRFIAAIRIDKPRYLRDQLLILHRVLNNTQEHLIEKALSFCIQQGINSANDFETLVTKFKQESKPDAIALSGLNPLNGTYPILALFQPQLSRIEDYHQILTPLNN